MATRVTWTKWGLRLACETSKRPLPKVAQAFPLPDSFQTASSLIEAVLESVPATGRQGIRITTLGSSSLPGTNDGTLWYLEHAAYVGAAPAILTWQSIPLGTRGEVSLLLSDPLPNATHRFRLVRASSPALGAAGRTVFPECAAVTTPDDSAIGTGAVSQVNLRSPNTDNLIPNPTSEGGTLTGVEGALVVNDPGNAYAGNCCRQISLAATNETALCEAMPCFYGDQFSFDAQAKVSNASGAVALVVKFLDSTGSVVGTATSSSVNSTGYVGVALQGSAPTGTQAMQAFVKASTVLAGGFGYLDNLSLRRSVKPAHMESDAGFRVLNALKNSGTSINDRTWYAGNDDSSTLGGAPNIGALTITRRRWDTTLKAARLDLKLQPTAANDNLDGMRFAKIAWYRQSSAGTSGTLTLIDTTYVSLTDRLFANTTDSNSANATLVTAFLNDAGVSSGFPAALVTIYNAFGPSATHCFYAAAANADGSDLTDNGTSWPAGLSGGSGGGTGGGGGGGGACPAPWTLLDLPGGIQKRADEIQAGDLVWTIHPTGTEGAWPVLAASLEEDAERWDLWVEGLPDALTFVPTHRFRVMDRGWVELQDLQPGDIILGDHPAAVLRTAERDRGPVVRITVDKAHSYQTSGLLSSNVKILD